MNNTNQQDIRIRIAATAEEYAQAFKIAYEVYFAKGFTPYSDYGMRATRYQFQPGAVVFLAYVDELPVATLSIYESMESDPLVQFTSMIFPSLFDEDEGQGGVLPSASGWPVEVGELIDSGIRVFELGALMVQPGTHGSSNPRVCLELFRSAWRYARRIRHAGALCAFVQSHHQQFYQKMLGFRQFGQPKDYQWNDLKINSVVPLHLDLDTCEEVCRGRFERFGNSARNLYKFFVLDLGQEIESSLRADLARKDGEDPAVLRAKFAHLLEGGNSCDSRHTEAQSWNATVQEETAGLQACIPCTVAL